MSYTEEMELQFDQEDDTPVADQEAVIEEFLEGTGRVAVDAAAGTGKTTTMLFTAAETVVREADNEHNPFEDILLTTFTRDAASELKTRLKKELQRHNDAGGDIPTEVFRWIETDSHIQTMDSFFHELLSEVALEVGLPPDFEIEEGIELEQLKGDIFEKLRIDYREEFDRLEDAYPDESWREYPPDTVEQMVENAHQKCRELGITPVEAQQQMENNLDEGHGNQTPPQTLHDVNTLLENVVYPGAEVTPAPTIDRDEREAFDELVDYVGDTYQRSLKLIQTFCTVLEAYEELYDKRTREKGVLTFTDATHVLRKYLSQSKSSNFAESLGDRFDYVFVDEFQDTSIAQCEILNELVPANSETNLLLIGDVKQSIFEWRSADPSIFSEIIQETQTPKGGARISYLDVDDVAYHPLTSNFRSHADIVAATNHVFSEIFEDTTRGDINDAVDIDYVPVDAEGTNANVATDQSHVHAVDLEMQGAGYPNRGNVWSVSEAERVAGLIAEMTTYDSDTNGEAPIHVFGGTDENDDPVTRPPNPGDITLVFRAKRFMEDYAETLRNYGINAAPAATQELFEQSEITLLIEVLYWFANPHDTGSILRILRSPLVACSDATLRALAAEEHYLEDLLDDWPSELPPRDQDQLQRLVELRGDLRWEREGSKTDLVNRILRHSSFDALVLADEDGLRRYGNIWLFTEIISDWEDEELLAYRDFVERLVTLREQAEENETSYDVVDTADRHDETTVSLTTVHAAKGREFPIVFLCDLLKQSTLPKTQHQRLVANRQRGLALRPRTTADEQFPLDLNFPTPNNSSDVWIGENRDTDETIPALTGPVWLSDERLQDGSASEGSLRYQNPLNQYVESEQAEFWRMFYVAFTRAEDHLFFGVSQLDDWIDFPEYTTWNAALNNLLMPSDGWDSTDTSVPIDGGPNDPDELDIGVNDVPTADPVTTESITAPDLDTLLQSPPSNRRDPVPFWPRTVTASRIHELMECQRRYQYQHVQEIVADRQQVSSTDPLEFETAETSTPKSLTPDQWGDIIHEAFQHRINDQDTFTTFLSSFDDAEIRDHVESVISAAQSSTAEFKEATDDSAQTFAEFPVKTVLDIGGKQLYIEGEIDLLYQVNGTWFLADYKTGERPDKEYEKRRYERQLRTYIWLLEREHSIQVQEASLIYVDIDASPMCSSTPVPEALDIDDFEANLRDRLDEFTTDPGAGLQAEPSDSRCSICPYANSRGGPCEEG